MDVINKAIKMHSRKASLRVSKTAAVQDEREVRAELHELPKEVKDEATVVTIEQTQLDKFDNGYVRVRKETPGGYTFTSKDFSKNEEDTINISEKLFKKFFPLGESPQTKTRYKWKGWDIDIMADGRVIAEFEMAPGQHSVEVPAILKIKAVLAPTIQVGSELTKKLPTK
jgi:hypothetical protein